MSEFFAKDNEFESLLSRVNDALTQVAAEQAHQEDSHFPAAMITGLPRSGTTVLYQLLARTRLVGYPSNVMALFWKAPAIGARLQLHLSRTTPTLSLDSVAGRTREPLDPHEFGYFWREALGHSNNSTVVDSQGWSSRELQAKLDAIGSAFQAPVVYKNFFALGDAGLLRSSVRDLRFLAVKRPAPEVVASLLKLRRGIGLRPDEQLGITHPSPKDVEPVSMAHRVAQQVASLEQLWREAEFDTRADSLIIEYEELCERPREIVRSVLEFLGVDCEQLDIERLPEKLSRGPQATSSPQPL